MDTRNKIIEKTIQLFRVYGIRSNTMDDIAREVGVSKKTLYQFIKDKKELIELVVNSEHNRLEKEISEINTSSINPIDQLIKINLLIFSFLRSINPASVNDLKKQYHSLYLSTKEKHQQLFFTAIIQNIQDGKEIGIYRSDVNEEVITKIHADRIEQILQSNSFRDVNQTAPEVLKEMTTYYIRGLISEKGEILLDKHLNEFNKYLNK